MRTGEAVSAIIVEGHAGSLREVEGFAVLAVLALVLQPAHLLASVCLWIQQGVLLDAHCIGLAMHCLPGQLRGALPLLQHV